MSQCLLLKHTLSKLRTSQLWQVLATILKGELTRIICTYIYTHILYVAMCAYTVKPETLKSGNFDKFGESGSNCQTLTFQSKATN